MDTYAYMYTFCLYVTTLCIKTVTYKGYILSIYNLSKEQINYIEENFFEFSFGKEDLNYLPNKEVFDKLTHPAELFYLAWIYNWDDGKEIMKWVVESPLCSEATAKLIFWRCAPDYYRRYNIEGDKEADENLDDAEALTLLKLIMDRQTKMDYHPISIAFDPADEVESLTQKNAKWDVPPSMFTKTEGLELHVPD